MNYGAEIEAGVQLYFDGMYESSSEKIMKIFHSDARVAGYLHGELILMTAEDFASFVSSQQPSPKENEDEVFLEIVSCEIVGKIASVKVRDKYLGSTFLDILSFINIDDEWQIYNKLFHVESDQER